MDWRMLEDGVNCVVATKHEMSMTMTPKEVHPTNVSRPALQA